MLKQTMIDGHVFTLDPSEQFVCFNSPIDSMRIKPELLYKVNGREKEIIKKAIDSLASLSYNGEVIKENYKTI